MRPGLRAGRRLASLILTALLATSAPAAARPYTPEDLVHQESFGRIQFDPRAGP